MKIQFKKISTKLIVTCLILGTLPLFIMGGLSIYKSRTALRNSSGKMLTLFASSTINKMDRVFFERQNDMQNFVNKRVAREGTHAELEILLNDFMRSYGFYDLMLVADADGRILMANTIKANGKPLDTSLLIGQSVKGEEWFEKCISGKIDPGENYTGDLAADQRLAQVAHTRGISVNMSAPILDKNGKVIRVWSNRISWERTVGEILSETRDEAKALGMTIDAQMLSKNLDLIYDEDPSRILTVNYTNSDKKSLKELASGHSGYTEEISQTTGKLSMYGYDLSHGVNTFQSLGWGLLLGQPSSEVEASAVQIRNFSLLIGGIVLLLILIFAPWFARSLARPLIESVGLLERVAEGDLTPRLKVTSVDETGRMGVALNRSLESLSSAMRSISENAQTLAAASEEMTAVSQTLSATAEETSVQANVVAAASDQVSGNIQTVATGAEEMSASIKEISKNSMEAAAVASEAVEVATVTSETMGKLGRSSAEIGEVVKVITSIAQQTNLLALNATIEAARAGEAGKGFAVVAGEVKELAKETAKATENIGAKIETIQADTKNAVDAILKISTIISKINDLQSSNAGAVEEQSATTNEMGRNVSDASRSSNEIAENIANVAQSAEGTTKSANDTMQAAQELARLASGLQNLVGRFKFNL